MWCVTLPAMRNIKKAVGYLCIRNVDSVWQPLVFKLSNEKEIAVLDCDICRKTPYASVTIACTNFKNVYFLKTLDALTEEVRKGEVDICLTTSPEIYTDGSVSKHNHIKTYTIRIRQNLEYNIKILSVAFGAKF